jgi:ribosomal protein S18 acetylase RimI-like enzyme
VQTERVTIERASGEHFERVAALLCDEPPAESCALFGDAERARAFRRELLATEPFPGHARTTVIASSGDDVVGVLQYSFGEPQRRLTSKRIRAAIHVLGVSGTFRLALRERARAAVEVAPRVDAFCIEELHVDPAHRNRGIASELLVWAEAEAATVGATSMALTTSTANRARELYERHGYTVTAEATDSHYEQYTGVAGRVLMEKALSPPRIQRAS